MDWLNSLLSLFKREPEYEHLEKFVEIERVRSADPAREKAYASAFGILLLGALVALGVGLLVRSIFLSFVVFAAASAFAVGSILNYNTVVSEEQKLLGQKRREARQFIHQLWLWKHSRRLKRELGAEIGELLDAASSYWLRTQAAVNSEGFRVEPDSNWAQARERIAHAMDSAMTRLLLLAQESRQYGTDFLTPGFDSARTMVEEMREMAKEAERLSDKLRIRQTGGLSDGPTDELRRTLADVKRLEEAEDEVDRLSQSG